MAPPPSFPIVVLVGPTASGKSTLAICLAQSFLGEIVNCDSLQLYQGFDIGTAKTPPADRGGIPHHLLDVLNPSARYSAGEYGRAAREIIRDISARGSLPVVVGGTGFYLRALLDGLPALPGREESLRARLLAREQRRSGALHRLLTRLEPTAAGRIHVRDVQKTLRALEVRLLTRSALPAPDLAEPFDGVTALILGLAPERSRLAEAIRARTEHMFEAGLIQGGLIDEVRGLLAAGCTGEEKPFESLGYKHALAYIQGRCSLADAVSQTEIETRQYAKRQMTWFRRDSRVHWLPGFGCDEQATAMAFDLVREFLAKFMSPG